MKLDEKQVYTVFLIYASFLQICCLDDRNHFTYFVSPAATNRVTYAHSRCANFMDHHDLAQA